MKQIMRALIAQRRTLLEPMPDGTARFMAAPAFADEADLVLKDLPYPRVSLRIEPSPSSVRATVPVRVYETVTVVADENSLRILDDVTDKLFEGIEEKPYFGYDATIVRATWGGTKYVSTSGTERKAVTTWNILVSWRAR